MTRPKQKVHFGYLQANKQPGLFTGNTLVMRLDTEDIDVARALAITAGFEFEQPAVIDTNKQFDRIPTPITDAVRVPGRSGDAYFEAFETLQEVSRRLERDRSLLLTALRGALECTRTIEYRDVPGVMKKQPIQRCCVCAHTWPYKEPAKETHATFCTVEQHRFVLQIVDRPING